LKISPSTCALPCNLTLLPWIVPLKNALDDGFLRDDLAFDHGAPADHQVCDAWISPVTQPKICKAPAQITLPVIVMPVPKVNRISGEAEASLSMRGSSLTGTASR
jgi:hypothetical protein